MRAPPDNGRSRPRAESGSDTRLITPTNSQSIADARVGDVVDLDEARVRRLLAPWPGWWGDAEIHSWTWAERSRGRWSA
jgi:hypothetical protein